MNFLNGSDSPKIFAMSPTFQICEGLCSSKWMSTNQLTMESLASKSHTFNKAIRDDSAAIDASCKDDFYLHEDEDAISTPPNILPPH